MADYSLEWRGLEIAGQIQDAWVDSMLILSREFTQQISDPKWRWPNNPSPRDIVDTGQLRSSQQDDIQRDQATFSWPVEYAPYVHEGYVGIDGKTYPARPWTREAIKAKPPSEIMQRILDL